MIKKLIFSILLLFSINSTAQSQYFQNYWLVNGDTLYPYNSNAILKFGNAIFNNVSLKGTLTTSGNITAPNISITGLSNNYIPYVSSGLLANSPIYTNGTNIGIGTTNLGVINTNANCQFGLDPDDRVLVISNSSGSALNLENTLPLDAANVGQRLGAIVFSNTRGQDDAHRQLAGIASYITGTNGSPIYTYEADLRFYTKPYGAATERMRITEFGNVGIETMAPLYQLVISNGGAAGIEMGAKNGNYGDIYAYNRSTSAYIPLVLQGGGGNVLIGTTSDNGKKLQVNGSASINGSISTNIVNATANYIPNINNQSIFMSASTAPDTVFLPTASGIAGRIYTIKKVDASTNAVVVKGNASELIDGSNVATLPNQYSTIVIQSNGTQWYIISKI